MNNHPLRSHPPRWHALSIALFVISVGLMGYLRLYLFADRFITLTYGVPMLLCLWHRDRRLLWGMGAVFSAMSAYKAFYLLPGRLHLGFDETLQWSMQVANIVAVGVAVHAVLNLVEKLRERNEEIERANQELIVRDEEISRQNEELAEQNEEIQQQSEEVYQQSEELQAQTEELQAATAEATKRQRMLQGLLETLRTTGDHELLERVSESLIELVGDAVAAAVTERRGDELVVVAHAGAFKPPTTRWSFDRSFAAIVMDQNRTAFIEDTSKRADLLAPPGSEVPFGSVLATPLRLRGAAAGTVEIYSAKPRVWTKEQFSVIEWMAAQCSLILEAKRLEAELMASNTRLDKQVNDRTAALQEMVNELEHFSYTITHDLRAPLRAMSGYSSFLSETLRGRVDDQSEQYLGRISRAAARMDRLITDALSYTKAMRQELALEPVDSGRLLRGMIESYPEFQPPHARIEIANPLPRVVANEAGLTQCFSNLLGNAVKFVDKGRTPQVTIRAETQNGHVRFWVEDNGIGIPRDQQSKVFVMFQRLSKDFDGTGIGLALVRKVTERMGGRAGVESEAGKGSRFWIDLPAATCEPAANAENGSIRRG